jgi:2-hydroxychromene-2-carboxylate isomerase
MAVLRFYFDFMSPFSYLAFERTLALAQRYGLVFEPVCLDLSALKLAAGNTGPSTREQPLKARYSGVDMQRWAKRYAIPLKRPEINKPERANAGFYGMRPGEEVAYMRAVWKRLWGAGEDVSTDAALAGIAAEIRWETAPYLAACAAPANAAKLADATRAATAAGIFGVPMVVVGEAMFWGNDRLDFVEEHLKSLSS